MTSVQRFLRTPLTVRRSALGLLAAAAVTLGSITTPLAGTAHADDGQVRGDQLVTDMDRQKPPTDCRFAPPAPAIAEVTPTPCPAATASPAATLIGAADGSKPGIIKTHSYAGLIGRVTDGTPTQALRRAIDGSKPSVIK